MFFPSFQTNPQVNQLLALPLSCHIQGPTFCAVPFLRLSPSFQWEAPTRVSSYFVCNKTAVKEIWASSVQIRREYLFSAYSRMKMSTGCCLSKKNLKDAAVVCSSLCMPINCYPDIALGLQAATEVMVLRGNIPYK